MPEDGIECESVTVISNDSLLVYNEKCYLLVFLGNCAYKIVNKQITDYLDEYLLLIRNYKCCITIELI